MECSTHFNFTHEIQCKVSDGEVLLTYYYYFIPKFIVTNLPKISRMGPPNPPKECTYLSIYMFIRIKGTCIYIMFIKWTGVFWIKCEQVCFRYNTWKSVISLKKAGKCEHSHGPQQRKGQNPPSYPTHPLPPMLSNSSRSCITPKKN